VGKKVNGGAPVEESPTAPSSSAAQTYERAQARLAEAQAAHGAANRHLAGIARQLQAIVQARNEAHRVEEALAAQVKAAQVAFRQAKVEASIHAGAGGEAEAEAKQEVAACENALETLLAEQEEQQRAQAAMVASTDGQAAELLREQEEARKEAAQAAQFLHDLERTTERTRLAAGREAIAAAAEHKAGVLAHMAELKAAMAEAEGDLQAAHRHADELVHLHPDLAGEVLSAGVAKHPAEVAVALIDAFDGYLLALEKAAGVTALLGLQLNQPQAMGWPLVHVLSHDFLNRATITGLLTPGGAQYIGGVENIRRLVAELRAKAAATVQQEQPGLTPSA
jgi:chemotaxis protein histidine kinase CheA